MARSSSVAISLGSGRSVVQLGNGFLLEVLKPSTSHGAGRAAPTKQLQQLLQFERSPYHSQGISSAMRCSFASEKRSIRPSQGAK